MRRRKIIIRSFKDSNDMVTEIVGTVLLLGIVVVFFSTLYGMVLLYPSSPISPSVAVRITKLQLTHCAELVFSIFYSPLSWSLPIL